MAYPMLTPEQEAFLSHEEGPAMIIATAGAGKTTVITQFIDVLRHRWLDPSRLLVLTFTKAAADQFKPRTATLTGWGFAKQVWMRTIHSLAYKICEEAGIIRGQESVLLDGTSIVRQIMVKIKLNADEVAVSNMTTDMAFYIGRLRPETWAPGGFLMEHFQTVLEEYTLAKRRGGSLDEDATADPVYDMDDLLEQSVKYLKENAEARAAWQERFDWILLDESQDTNLLQWKLLNLLVRPGRPNFVVVGDDDQSVYSWRGSDSQELIEFADKMYPGATVYPLSVNHRCPENILKFAAKLIEKNTVRLAKSIRSSKPGGHEPEVIRPVNPTAEIKYVVDQLKAAKARAIAGGKEPAQMLMDYAVLFRTGAQALALVAQLENEGIPYNLLSGLKDPFGRWMARDVLSILKCAHDKAAYEDVERMLKRLRRDGLSGEKAYSYLRQAFRHLQAYRIARESAEATDRTLDEAKFEVKDTMDAILWTGRQLSPWAFDSAIHLSAQLRMIQTKKAAEVIGYILDGVGYRTAMLDYCRFSGSDMNEALEHLQAIALMVSPDAEPIAYLELAANPPKKKKDDRKPSAGPVQGVVLSTMHSAKGLEWGTVYIVGAVEANHPAGDANTEEERRLFYVAMTRAKEHLYISAPLTWNDKPEAKPTIFLEEAELMPPTVRSKEPDAKGAASFTAPGGVTVHRPEGGMGKPVYRPGDRFIYEKGDRERFSSSGYGSTSRRGRW